VLKFVLCIGFLTVGIPTTYRKTNGHTYLMQTLDSLLKSIQPTEVDNILIMVFIADLDADKRHTLTQALVSHYPDQLNSGLLQVVYCQRVCLPSVGKPQTELR
jgi:hypothetical protein